MGTSSRVSTCRKGEFNASLSSPYALGPWTPPPPRRLVQAPFGPPSMYVCFMGAVRTFLMPVAQLTVRTRRL
jgi:hypothetical protein